MHNQIALDGEHAAAVTQVEEVDQLRIDVELMAVLAEPARDPEAQPLTPVRHPEGGVEPGRDEPAIAAGATLAELKGRGAPRVVLSTAEQNGSAQRLFARAGFRRTMIEMTRELDAP